MGQQPAAVFEEHVQYTFLSTLTTFLAQRTKELDIILTHCQKLNSRVSLIVDGESMSFVRKEYLMILVL